MALCGGFVSAVVRPPPCKASAASFAPLGRTHLALRTKYKKTGFQQKTPAGLRILPMSLRSSSSSFMDLGLLRLEAVKLAHRGRSSGGALSSECSVVLSIDTLRWVFTVAALALMLVKNTGVRKSFLVPLLALEAPGDVVSWIRGDYGLWTAFLVFIVRLFYPIPGELELPLLFLLLVIIAPYQALNLRGTQAGMVISIAVAAYLAFQHFSRAGGLKKAFDQETVVPTIAVVLLITVPLVFLIQGFIF